MADRLCIICRELFEAYTNAKICQKESCQKEYLKNYMRSYRHGIRKIEAEQRMSRISKSERTYLNSLKTESNYIEPKKFQSLPIQRFADIVNRFLRMQKKDK